MNIMEEIFEMRI